MKSHIDQAVRLVRAAAIPELPLEVIELKQEIESEYANYAEMSVLIDRNPRLYRKFITIANLCTNERSPEDPITSTKQAIEVLGIEEVKNLFYASALLENMIRNEPESKLFDYAIKVAVVAQQMATDIAGISRSEAYLTAIMSELGAIVLQRCHQEFLDEVYSRYHNYPLSKEKAYLEHYQTTLEYISALICKKWKVDSVISKAILLQNKTLIDTSKPDGERITKLSAILNVAKITLCEYDESCFITDEMRTLRIRAVSVLGEIHADVYLKAYAAIKSHKGITKTQNLQKPKLLSVAA